MTQLLNRYQQAVLAELNIPIFLHHQSSFDLYETCDAASVKVVSDDSLSKIPEPKTPEASQSEPNSPHVNDLKSDSFNVSQSADPVAPTLSSADKPDAFTAPAHITDSQTANTHSDTQVNAPLTQQPQKNDNIDVIADKLTHASLQGQSDEQDAEQLERDKAIANKTKSINQLASILPTTSTASEVTENHAHAKVSKQFGLILSAIEPSDLSILQVWAHNNDWIFKQDGQGKVIANHPKLSQNMDFDLSQPAEKKRCWQCILSCLD